MSMKLAKKKNYICTLSKEVIAFISSFLWFYDIHKLALCCKYLNTNLHQSTFVAWDRFVELMRRCGVHLSHGLHSALNLHFGDVLVLAARAAPWPTDIDLYLVNEFCDRSSAVYSVREVAVEAQTSRCVAYQGIIKGRNRAFVANNHFPLIYGHNVVPDSRIRPPSAIPFVKPISKRQNQTVPALSCIAYFEITIHPSVVPKDVQRRTMAALLRRRSPNSNNNNNNNNGDEVDDNSSEGEEADQNEFPDDDDGNDIEELTNTSPSLPCVGIGISRVGFPLLGKMPGWDTHSYGYHSDDGRFFHGSSTNGTQLTPTAGGEMSSTYGEGDTVGCGFIYPPLLHHGEGNHPRLFFTKNGKLVGSSVIRDQYFFDHAWFPTVGTDSYTPIEMNFGCKGVPFAFDVELYEQACFYQWNVNLRKMAAASVAGGGHEPVPALVTIRSMLHRRCPYIQRGTNYGHVLPKRYPRRNPVFPLFKDPHNTDRGDFSLRSTMFTSVSSSSSSSCKNDQRSGTQPSGVGIFFNEQLLIETQSVSLNASINRAIGNNQSLFEEVSNGGFVSGNFFSRVFGQYFLDAPSLQELFGGTDGDTDDFDGDINESENELNRNFEAYKSYLVELSRWADTSAASSSGNNNNMVPAGTEIGEDEGGGGGEEFDDAVLLAPAANNGHAAPGIGSGAAIATMAEMYLNNPSLAFSTDMNSADAARFGAGMAATAALAGLFVSSGATDASSVSAGTAAMGIGFAAVGAAAAMNTERAAELRERASFVARKAANEASEAAKNVDPAKAVAGMALTGLASSVMSAAASSTMTAGDFISIAESMNISAGSAAMGLSLAAAGMAAMKSDTASKFSAEAMSRAKKAANDAAAAAKDVDPTTAMAGMALTGLGASAMRALIHSGLTTNDLASIAEALDVSAGSAAMGLSFAAVGMAAMNSVAGAEFRRRATEAAKKAATDAAADPRKAAAGMAATAALTGLGATAMSAAAAAGITISAAAMGLGMVAAGVAAIGSAATRKTSFSREWGDAEKDDEEDNEEEETVAVARINENMSMTALDKDESQGGKDGGGVHWKRDNTHNSSHLLDNHLSTPVTKTTEEAKENNDVKEKEEEEKDEDDDEDRRLRSDSLMSSPETSFSSKAKIEMERYFRNMQSMFDSYREEIVEHLSFPFHHDSNNLRDFILSFSQTHEDVSIDAATFLVKSIVEGGVSPHVAMSRSGFLHHHSSAVSSSNASPSIYIYSPSSAAATDLVLGSDKDGAVLAAAAQEPFSPASRILSADQNNSLVPVPVVGIAVKAEHQGRNEKVVAVVDPASKFANNSKS